MRNRHRIAVAAIGLGVVLMPVPAQAAPGAKIELAANLEGPPANLHFTGNASCSGGGIAFVTVFANLDQNATISPFTTGSSGTPVTGTNTIHLITSSPVSVPCDGRVHQWTAPERASQPVSGFFIIDSSGTAILTQGPSNRIVATDGPLPISVWGVFNSQ